MPDEFRGTEPNSNIFRRKHTSEVCSRIELTERRFFEHTLSVPVANKLGLSTLPVVPRGARGRKFELKLNSDRTNAPSTYTAPVPNDLNRPLSLFRLRLSSAYVSCSGTLCFANTSNVVSGSDSDSINSTHSVLVSSLGYSYRPQLNPFIIQLGLITRPSTHFLQHTPKNLSAPPNGCLMW